MPEEITDVADLQRHLEARRGFLASKKANRLAYTVHDLSYFCDAPIDVTSENQTTYYAEDTRAFTQAWGATGWIECGSCLHTRLRR